MFIGSCTGCMVPFPISYLVINKITCSNDMTAVFSTLQEYFWDDHRILSSSEAYTHNLPTEDTAAWSTPGEGVLLQKILWGGAVNMGSNTTSRYINDPLILYKIWYPNGLIFKNFPKFEPQI